jgi:hypothetical protein
MRKFFGSMGSVSRIAVESQALKSNILGDPSVRIVDVHLRLGMTEKDYPCSSILSGSPVAVCPIRIGSASARTCRNGSTG